MTERCDTLVLGIGNLLWADEGFGVRAVQALRAGWQWPGQVRLMDGGTQGLYLLGPLCDSRRVLVLDAIDFGLPPGTLKVCRDADVPEWSDTVMSLHQASFQELLSLARLRGRFPETITLIGVQPVLLDDLGGSLSPAVQARVGEAVALALAELAAWGVPGVPRVCAPDDAPDDTPDDALSARALDQTAYEQGRPDAALACRVGDARFLNQVHANQPGAD